MRKQNSVRSHTKSVLENTKREEREDVDTKRNEKLVEKELKSLVKDIWKKYDRDDNGVLDRDEIKSFVADILNDVKLDKQWQTEPDSAKLDINEIFDQIDKDGNGTVDIDEMVMFLIKVSGFTFLSH